MVLPVLVDWATKPSAVIAVSYGLWSVLAAVSALGVAVFGVRDYLASGRSSRRGRAPAADLMSAVSARKTVLVTGATGVIGR